AKGGRTEIGDIDWPLEQIGENVEIHQRSEEEQRPPARGRERDHRSGVERRAGDRQGWAHATLHSVPARSPGGRGPDSVPDDPREASPPDPAGALCAAWSRLAP